MRTVLFGLVLCVTYLAAPPQVEVIVPSSAFHSQNWLRPQFHDNPKPGFRGKASGSLAEFVSPEVISKIVVDQYAGPEDDVRRYLTAMPTAAAEHLGPTLELCQSRTTASNGSPVYGARLDWTSISTVTFESGRSGRVAVATVVVSNIPKLPDSTPPKTFGLSDDPGCLGLDRVPVDSLYVSYVDPDGYTWAFVVLLQKNK